MGCNECNHQYGPPSECWRLVRVHRRHLHDTIPVEAPPIIAILPLDTDCMHRPSMSCSFFSRYCRLAEFL